MEENEKTADRRLLDALCTAEAFYGGADALMRSRDYDPLDLGAMADERKIELAKILENTL